MQENELRKLVSSSGPAASALEKFTAEKLENEIPDEKPATPESTEPVVENGLYSWNRQSTIVLKWSIQFPSYHWEDDAILFL